MGTKYVRMDDKGERRLYDGSFAIYNLRKGKGKIDNLQRKSMS